MLQEKFAKMEEETTAKMNELTTSLAQKSEQLDKEVAAQHKEIERQR